MAYLWKVACAFVLQVVAVSAAGSFKCTQYAEPACAGSVVRSYELKLDKCYKSAQMPSTLSGEYYYLLTATRAEDVVLAAVYTDEDCEDVLSPSVNRNAWSAVGPWVIDCIDDGSEETSTGTSTECEIVYKTSVGFDVVGGLLFAGGALGALTYIGFHGYNMYYGVPVAHSPTHKAISSSASAQNLVEADDTAV